MKPEIGSKWTCVGRLNQCSAGEVVTVKAVDERYVHVEEGRAYLLRRFADGEFIPLSPAPAEPAKAAGWKNGDRFTVSGTVFDADYGVEWLRCVLDGHALSRPPIPRSCLRPEAAPPAAAPARPAAECCTLVACAKHGMDVTQPDCKCFGVAASSCDHRGFESQIADLRGDLAEAKSISDGFQRDLYACQRERAQLRSALRDATAKWQRRGPL